MKLTTPRLQLPPVQIDDVQLAHSLWTNSDVRYFLFDAAVTCSHPCFTIKCNVRMMIRKLKPVGVPEAL